MKLTWLAGAFAGVVAFTAPTAAQEITLAYGSAVTSIDPLFHNLSSNINFSLNLFDRLVEQDAHQRPVPGLAASWKAIDDTVWEFKLRSGVRFHDGSIFGPEDVAASLKRVAWMPNSPSPFTIYTRAITQTIIVDPTTIRFRTAAPYPLMPVDISSIHIIERQYEQAPTVDFNSGRAAIGTGPYKFVSYTAGDRLVLARNDDYWGANYGGAKPAWAKATLRIIPNNLSRIAALLAGDVQGIDNVPPTDLARLAADKNVSVVRTLSNTVMFIHLDQFREQTPDVTDKSGAPLPHNPFKDRRVRQAISKAINRDALVERVMEGAAHPAGDLLAEGFFGVSPNTKPDKYDPDAARKLLAEAGYPNGFAMTIHGPNDRYINDAAILQAVAPMLTRVGIDTKVVALPWAVFIAQASAPNYAYSALLIGNGATTGEMSFPLRAQEATVNAATGMGASNRSRYSNPEVDALLAQAMATVDDAKRERLLQQTAETAMADQALVPLFYGDDVYALRKGLAYTPRPDGYMAAFLVRPAN
jgi:peptide/nickel transport system substrate-binding protein